MTSSTSSRLAVLLLTGAALSFGAPAAFADNNQQQDGNGDGGCYTTDGQGQHPSSSCDGADQETDGQGGRDGESKHLHYKGLKGKSHGNVHEHSQDVLLGSFTVNSSGVADITVRLAKGLTGTHEIVTDATAANGKHVKLVTTVFIQPSTSGGTGSASGGTGSTGAGTGSTSGALPFTGAPTGVEAGIGAGLVALGGGALVLGRRRRAASPSA